MIKDKEQFENFIDILYPLERDEVYFLSLSARNKYLDKDEREFYSLGQTEMFARTVIKDLDNPYFYFDKMYSTLTYKKTRSGKEFPEKALVTYININPSSIIEACNMFQKEMSAQMHEILKALSRDKEPNYTYVRQAERVLMNCIQKSKSRRCFIDIDFDIYDNYEIINKFQTSLTLEEIKYHVIETKSGFHMLIDLKSMKGKNFRLDEAVKIADKQIKEIDKDLEVKVNSNGMIPVPGTLQAGKLVTFF